MKISKNIERSMLFSDLWIELMLIFISFFVIRFGWGFVDGFRQGLQDHLR